MIFKNPGRKRIKPKVGGDIEAALRSHYVVLNLTISIDAEDVGKAVKWANAHRYTYIRDDDLTGLVFGALGNIPLDSVGLEESYLDTVYGREPT